MTRSRVARSATRCEIEFSLVEGQQPACRDSSLVDRVVDADRRPAALPACDRGRTVGQSGQTVTVADEDVSAMHLKGSVGEFATTPEVVEDRVDPVVAACDVVLAGHDPA